MCSGCRRSTARTIAEVTSPPSHSSCAVTGCAWWVCSRCRSIAPSIPLKRPQPSRSEPMKFDARRGAGPPRDPPEQADPDQRGQPGEGVQQAVPLRVGLHADERVGGPAGVVLDELVKRAAVDAPADPEADQQARGDQHADPGRARRTDAGAAADGAAWPAARASSGRVAAAAGSAPGRCAARTARGRAPAPGGRRVLDHESIDLGVRVAHRRLGHTLVALDLRRELGRGSVFANLSAPGKPGKAVEIRGIGCVHRFACARRTAGNPRIYSPPNFAGEEMSSRASRRARPRSASASWCCGLLTSRAAWARGSPRGSRRRRRL
jgi:hypothetical protein